MDKDSRGIEELIASGVEVADQSRVVRLLCVEQACVVVLWVLGVGFFRADRSRGQKMEIPRVIKRNKRRS